MQVYFDCFLRGNAGETPCDTVQTVNARFMAGGLERVIPAFYLFEEGIVFDLITVMDLKIMQAFYEKYQVWENMSGELTETQYQKAVQENPYQSVDIAKLWINGSSQISGLECSSIWNVPGIMEDSDREAVEELIQAYPQVLDDKSCFFCERCKVNTMEKWEKKPLHTMQIRTREQLRTEAFELEAEVEPGEEVSFTFTHPVAGAAHQIYLYDTKRKEQLDSEMEICFYTGIMEVVPKLQKGDRLLFDSSIPCRKRTDGNGAGQVSVIGGSSGPVAVFMAWKDGEAEKSRHGGEVKPCFSKPFWSGEDGKSLFRITGLEYVVKEGELITVDIQ